MDGVSFQAKMEVRGSLLKRIKQILNSDIRENILVIKNKVSLATWEYNSVVVECFLIIISQYYFRIYDE